MAGVLVASDVSLDVVNEDAKWLAWSSAQLKCLAQKHTPVINRIIYSGVSIRFDRIEVLDRALPAKQFRREPLPREAGFLAGKCFLCGMSAASPAPRRRGSRSWSIRTSSRAGARVLRDHPARR